MSRLFQPSPFWIAARRLLSWRFAVAVLIIVACFELVARAAPRIVGKQVHQPYLYNERVCLRECTNQGRSLKWVTNGRGARGTLYHGQPVRVAVLGSSTTSNTLLDQHELWTERLRELLGPDVHIDNYARDGAADLESTTILRHFARIGRRYDAVLIMSHIAVNNVERRLGDDAAFRFSRDWTLHGRPLEFPGMLRRRGRQQLRQEARLSAIVARLVPQKAKPVRHNPLDPANRELRRRGEVRLVDYELTLTPAEEADVRERTRRLVEAAQAVADRVWMIRQPVAYDEREVAGVAERWVSLVPVPGRSDVFLSNRSYAGGLRLWSGTMADEAKKLGIAVIDLDAAMRPLLAERADLFEDKWHFSPAGADVSARLLADAVGGELTANPNLPGG